MLLHQLIFTTLTVAVYAEPMSRELERRRSQHHYIFVSVSNYKSVSMRFSQNNPPLRDTQQGKMEGVWVREGDTVAEAYMSVPFAQAPIGRLRFGVRISLKDFF